MRFFRTRHPTMIQDRVKILNRGPWPETPGHGCALPNSEQRQELKLGLGSEIECECGRRWQYNKGGDGYTWTWWPIDEESWQRAANHG